MALCADDAQSPNLSGNVVQLDIRAPAGHIGGDRHRAVYAGISHNLRLQLMEFRVQDLVGHAALFQHLAEKL